MNYEEFASDLPHQRMVFTSAGETEETMKLFGVDQMVRQLGNGQFRSDLAVRITKHVGVYADRFNTAVSMHLNVSAGTVCFLFPRTASGRFLASGENVGNDKLIVLRHGQGIDIVGPALFGSEHFVISEKRFAEMTETLCPSFVRPEGTPTIGGNTAQLHTLRAAILHLVAHPEVEVSDEDLDELLAVAIAWMGHSAAYRGPKPLTINPARARIAKHTQEFIVENYENTVSIEGLCRTTGVGVRTLQRCFREYFDVTISEYLKTVRLNAAYRSLDAVQTGHSTVAAIALQHGFTHLGRFSVEFRERFGESPSATLMTRDGRKSHLNEIPDTTFVAATGSIH